MPPEEKPQPNSPIPEHVDLRPNSRRANQALGRDIKAIVAQVEAMRGPAPVKPPAEKPAEKPAEPAAEEKAPEPAEERGEGTPAPAPPEATTTEREPSAEGALARIRQRERALEGQRQQHRRAVEQFEAQRKAQETELAQARESLALAQRDPFAWLERYAGIRREAFGAMQGGRDVAPSVELARRDAQIAELRQQLDGIQRGSREREMADRRERELAAFEVQARAGVERWPLAARYSPEKLKRRGWEIASAEAAGGVSLSNEEVLDRLEAELAEVAALAKTPKSSPKAPKTSETTTESAGQPTLTARGQTSGGAAKPNLLKMSARERIAYTTSLIEQERAERARR